MLKYWEERALEVEKQAFKRGQLSVKAMQSIYKDTLANMDKEIQTFYAKYGTIAKTEMFETLADGTKVVTGTTEKLIVEPLAAQKALKSGTRLSALQLQLKEMLGIAATEQEKEMIKTLSEIANNTYALNTFNLYKGIGIGGNFNMLSERAVNALIKHEINGKNFSQRIWKNSALLNKSVNQTLKTGIVQGLSNKEMAVRLAERMDVGFSSAKRLIQTETTNVLNQATLQSYEDSGIISQYQYVATLDSKTSDICQDLDGKVFDTKDAEVGVNYPPTHPNCRSTTIAYFNDSPAGLTRLAKDLEGKTYSIPANMNYKEWVQEYVK